MLTLFSRIARTVQRTVPAIVVAMILTVAPEFCRAAASQDAAAPVPPEIIAAIKSLKGADADGRQKVYDLLAAQGDARLIPALKAYKDGALQLRDGKLAVYGERVTLPDKGSVLPLVDALTGQPILGADGQPLYFPKPDLSNAMRSPPRSERGAVNDLIGSLSLLDPDPAARTASIRDVAERAARAIPDPADSQRYLEALATCSAALTPRVGQTQDAAEADALRQAITAIATAIADRPKSVASAAPGDSTASAVKIALLQFRSATHNLTDQAVNDCISATSAYVDKLEHRKTILDELPKTRLALNHQLEQNPKSAFAPALHEAIASIDICLGDSQAQIASAAVLGKLGTSRAANLLAKIVEASNGTGEKDLHDAAVKALGSATRYQSEVRFIQNTFAGLSSGSILILMALGLSIIFGLMGVINMAQGEFMMVGAFTTFVVAEAFKHLGPGAYAYYLLAAVPAAFLVSGVIGYLVEWLVIRHLYGRPLETLLATWGIGGILIWAVRWKFGDNVSVAPPRWMEGGWELAPDLFFPLNRVYIIFFCAICIAVVYFVVNGTKLGLLLRATTQNREMANALGVPTRRVDGMTFAFGAGLAGLAGVAVPLYNKINPNIGQEYIVDCFMVVVVGGVGKLAGAVWAGLGLGFIGKYLEPLLGMIPSLASGASVIGKVLVLGLIIVFLQWRPQGLFPPKGRNADA